MPVQLQDDESEKMTNSSREKWIRRYITLLAMCCLWLIVAGCGGGSVEVVEVSGTVRQDGKPLPEVGIVFSPDPEKIGQEHLLAGAKHSYAITDKDGKYRLQYSGGNPEFGAEVGWHRITAIDYMAENSRDNPMKPRISLDYSLAGRTDLKYEVKPEKEQSFDFELKPRK